MPLQAEALRRCASCARWNGAREADAPGFVRIDADDSAGLCVGGPWDGSPRRALAACGRWQRWPELAAAADSE